MAADNVPLLGGAPTAPMEYPEASPLPLFSPKPNLMDQAKQQYPILNNYDIGYKDSIGRGQGYLESWPPGEPGDQQVPRPSEFPLNKFGVENYRADTRPIDLVGDIVSHHLIEADPTIKKTYQEFTSSLQPWQHDQLQRQYQYARANYNEARTYDEWKQASGLPAYFRGYPFQQWDHPEQFYTPQQMQRLDQMMKYLGGR